MLHLFLLQNLGAFGPLKCREIYALDKLQKQCKVIENLLKLAKAGPQVELHSGKFLLHVAVNVDLAKLLRYYCKIIKSP